MTNILSRFGRGRLLTALLAILASALTAGAFQAEQASTAYAYNGKFCYGILLQDYNDCESSYVDTICRAISYSPQDWTYVEIDTTYGYGSDEAGTDEQADTGCLAQNGNGNGFNAEATGGAGYYYGWLYPRT